MPGIPGEARKMCMFEKRKRWTGWTLAMALMLSLAPQGAIAAEMTPSVVQEETVTSSSASGETAETGAEAGTSSGQEDGTGSSGEETVQPGTDLSGSEEVKTESLTETGTDELSSEADDSAASSEGSYPAVVLEAMADDGTSIKIDAPEGAFPEGIHVTVRSVEPDQILDAIQTAADDPELATENIVAYDFDFWLDDGTHQIEPKKEISVQIGLPELESGDTVSAWHMDSESDETAESESVTAESDSGTATITSDVFSIHAIVVRRAPAGGVKIDYDEQSTIHSVTDTDGTKIILFCMNNGLHWPHKTPSIQNVPKYTETTIQEFCKENNISDSDGNTLARRLKNILFAGYPNNGYALYQLVNQETALTESEFNQLLDPPVYLRTDFFDSIGNETFTYTDRTNTDKMGRLTQFLKAVADLRPNGSTASGLTYTQLIALPFWKAAYCMVYSDSPLDAYSAAFISGTYVTQGQAYDSTSRAIWTFLRNSKVPNNTPVDQDTLTTKLLDAVDYDNVLDQPVSTDIFGVWGDKTFQYSPEDGKWHTGSLMLHGYNYMVPFMLSLPDGVSEENGKTQVNVMERFSLVASSPEDVTKISLSASVPWMDGDLKVYKPIESATASDRKGFQNMVGAVIRTTDVTIPVSIKRIDENTGLTFTKKWEDHNNQDGIRPTTADYASKLHLMNDSSEVKDVKPTVTDNGDNTWTVSYSNLPKYAGGTAIAYSVKEDSINGYTGGTLTNTHTPDVTSVTFTKKWEDAGDQDKLRPSTTDYASRLHLLSGSTEVNDVKPTVTDNGDNTWTIAYSNLPKYTGGSENIYSVKEDSINGYTADAETVKAGGTLTNTHKVPSSTPSTKETNSTNTQNVQTSTTPTSETNPANTQNVTATTTPASETDTTESSIKTSDSAGTAANGSNTSSSGAAKTGDSSALELYGLLSALSMAALLILLGMKHRRNKV